MPTEIDVDGATTALGLLFAAIAAVGAVKLGPAGLAVAYNWVKGAIFA